MIKQRMLSAMMLVVALNITNITQNCTTQTMLEVSAKDNSTKVEKNRAVKLYTTTKVNLRKIPSIKSKILSVININTAVKPIKQSKKWVKVKYKNKTGYIYKKYLSKKKKKNRWNIKLSKQEISDLNQIVYYESRGECDIGQQSVVEVILNRIKSKKFPNTLNGVISQKGQFSSYSLLGGTKNKEEYDTVKKNVIKTLTGGTSILPNNYLYFSMYGHKDHRDMVQIGSHQFCTTY